MKAGQRKLCDIHCHLPHAVEMRADIENYLERRRIPYAVYSRRGKDDADFWRYVVPSGQVRAARAELPLTLRNFSGAAEGGKK